MGQEASFFYRTICPHLKRMGKLGSPIERINYIPNKIGCKDVTTE